MASTRQKGKSTKGGSVARGKSTKGSSVARGGKQCSDTKAKRQGKDKDALFSSRGEVALLLLLFVCVLLFLSYFGIGGEIGAMAGSFFFGLFGLVAYILPICIFVGVAFLVSNRSNRVATMKLVAGVLFFVFLCLFVELVVVGDAGGKPLDSYHYGVEHRSGGGLVGGALAQLLCKAFGLVGAYVFDIIMLIICLVLITERSFLGGVQKGGKKVYHVAKEDAKRYREHRERKREEQREREQEQEQRLRRERVVEGVALDTKIVPPTRGKSDGLSELTPSSSKPARAKRGAAVEPIPTQTQIVEPIPTQTQVVEPIPAQAQVVEPIPSEEGGGQNLTAFFSTEDGRLGDAPTGTRTGDAPSGIRSSDAPAGTCTGDAPSPHSGIALGDSEGLAALFPTEDELAGIEELFPESEFGEADEPHVEAQFEEMPLSDSQPQPGEGDFPKLEFDEVPLPDDLARDLPPKPPVAAPPKREYVFPPTSLLKPGNSMQADNKKHLQETALRLQQILKNFGVNVTITNVSCGPTVTRYEIQPEPGVKVSKIVNLSDDIKLNLAAADIRIEAPIPGKAAIGIEVPNKEKTIVRFRDLVESEEFQKHPSNICFTAGKDIAGQVVLADIAKMPHVLIAGATGSGKSVCINTIIMSILYKANPEDVKLILIDPKVVELSVYNGIPHLYIPVVTDPKKAAGALHWAVTEMDERYKRFADFQVRDLKGYNQKVAEIADIEDETKPQKLPQIVIIVDELADLMMVAPGDVEDAICRLAQLARAAGIHLVIATQRPSVDVITGLIKANMPSRIAFSVSSGVDSRTILDMNGAEKLLGNGDMLFYPQGYPKPLRVQGPFVSDGEVEAVVNFLKEQNVASYNEEIEEKLSNVESSPAGEGGGGNERDAYFVDAGKFIIEKDKASIGMLQRWFKIGFNRAARIMDQLEEAGVVGPEEGTKPRKVLMGMEQFEEYVEEYV